jgi:prevent-host-death family protein
MCHNSAMSTISARQLHHDTSAVLDEVARGKTFRITRNGKNVGRLAPAKAIPPTPWDDIMGEVWAAQNNCSGKSRNPVLVEREKRRR